MAISGRGKRGTVPRGRGIPKVYLILCVMSNDVVCFVFAHKVLANSRQWRDT